MTITQNKQRRPNPTSQTPFDLSDVATPPDISDGVPIAIGHEHAGAISSEITAPASPGALGNVAASDWDDEPTQEYAGAARTELGE